jgi:exonuclease SbcD
MSISIMHLADVHLGAPMKWLGEKTLERQQDINTTFIKAIDVALNQADLVLLAGDIFDHHHPAEEIVTFFRNQIQRLSTAGIPVVAVPGNHDGYYYPDSVWRTREFPSLNLITSPKIDIPLSLEIKGIPVHIYGMAFQPTLSKGPFDTFTKKSEPGIHIALIHGSLMHSPEWGIRAKDVPLDPKNLAASGMNYVALGHYHRFSETNLNGIPVVYPGSPEGLNWQEDGDRYLVTATFDNGSVSVNRQVCQKHTIHNLTVDITAWEEPTTESIKKHLLDLLKVSDDLYQITVKGTAQELIDFQRIQEEANSHCFFAQVNDFTSILEAKTIERIATEPTIKGSFVRAVRKRMNNPAWEREVVELALRLGLEKFTEGTK